jgi:hypothetical protein
MPTCYCSGAGKGARPVEPNDYRTTSSNENISAKPLGPLSNMVLTWRLVCRGGKLEARGSAVSTGLAA